MERSHICFVAPDTWPVLSASRHIQSAGGAQVQQSLLAKMLVRRGFRVSMICNDYGQPDLVTVDGVTVLKYKAPIEGLPIIRYFHPRLTGIWSALRRVDADVYYQRTAGAATGVTAAFARRYGRRFVYAVAHDFDLARDHTWKVFQRPAGWRDRQLFQLGVKLADCVVAQHVGQVRDCERWYGRAATLIPNCYAAQPSECCDLNGVVLWVSTLRTWKRPEMFLELARRLPHLRFRMVGGPSPQPGDESVFARIKALAALIPNLEFIGFVPFSEIGRQFNAARVFVNTSDSEGFPNTFLQAWSRGIPTVSFWGSGSSLQGEQVVNVAGNLEDMAAVVGRLMQDNRYWKEKGERARAYYEQFHTPKAVVDAYDQLFSRTGHLEIARMPGQAGVVSRHQT
jgi:glycosyltransferase involved in cell wall biosynthesis